MKKVALYCRVSTASQEREQTIKTQLDKLREIYGKQIIKEYLDDGYSGAYLSRPALNQLREDAKAGLFNVVALYALDRLSRTAIHQIGLRQEFKKLGVKLEVQGQEVKEDTAHDRFINNTLANVNELEKEMIASRMRDGKYRKARTEFVWGTPPFGYRIIKDEDGKRQLAIDNEEARIIKTMFGIYLEEHGLGKTAKRIYEMGFKSRSGKVFSSFMIGQFLRDEVYIGNFYYGKTYPSEPEKPIKKNRKHQLSSRKYRPRKEWKLLKVPQIIDQITFDRVQEIRKKMAEQSLKPTRHYLCQGLIVCELCGYRYIGKMRSKSHREESPNGNYFYYVCPKRSSRRRLGEPICLSKEMNTRDVDQYVWEYVSSLIQDKERVKAAIRQLKEKRESMREFNQSIYDNLMAKKEEIKRQKSKILDLYATGKYSEEDLDAKIAEYDVQQEDLDRRLKEVEIDLQKVNEIETLEAEIEQTCLEYQDKIQNADFDLKKRILKKWVKEITLPKDGGIRIRVMIPEPEQPINFVSPQRELVGRSRISASEDV